MSAAFVETPPDGPLGGVINDHVTPKLVVLYNNAYVVPFNIEQYPIPLFAEQFPWHTPPINEVVERANVNAGGIDLIFVILFVVFNVFIKIYKDNKSRGRIFNYEKGTYDKYFVIKSSLYCDYTQNIYQQFYKMSLFKCPSSPCSYPTFGAACSSSAH